MPVIEGGGGATTQPSTTTGGRRTPRPDPVQRYLDSIGKDKAEEQIDEDGNTFLTRYGIPDSMWDMWAAAAGLPGANYKDEAAARRVAAWAARSLYAQFGNWGLVAVGWRFGYATAAKVQSAFGNVSGEMLNSIMGMGSAKFVNQVIEAMYEDPEAAQDQYFDFDFGSFPMGGQGGSMELTFETEEWPEPEAAPKDPVQMLLMNVLGAMADKVAGGKRLDVEETVTNQVPTDEQAEEARQAPPLATTPEDTEYMTEAG